MASTSFAGTLGDVHSGLRGEIGGRARLAPRDQVTTTSTIAPSTTTTIPACHRNLASETAVPANASQLVTVETSRRGVSFGTLTAWQRVGTCWSVARGPFFAVLAYRGVNPHKHEGDNTTPAGSFGLETTMFGTAPNPGVRYRYHRLVCGDWWVAESRSRDYNLFEHVPCGVNPPFNTGSSEALWTATRTYQSFAVLTYNTARTPGRGSAIFLHASNGAPTTGCVSTKLAHLDAILRWLDPADHPRIVIGLPGTITTY